MNRADGLDGRKMSFHTGSRWSQPPLALSVPPSRFTSRVGGGSAFYVRPTTHYEKFATLDLCARSSRCAAHRRIAFHESGDSDDSDAIDACSLCHRHRSVFQAWHLAWSGSLVLHWHRDRIALLEL